MFTLLTGRKWPKTRWQKMAQDSKLYRSNLNGCCCWQLVLGLAQHLMTAKSPSRAHWQYCSPSVYHFRSNKNQKNSYTSTFGLRRSLPKISKRTRKKINCHHACETVLQKSPPSRYAVACCLPQLGGNLVWQDRQDQQSFSLLFFSFSFSCLNYEKYLFKNS